MRAHRDEAPRTWQHMGEQASPESLLWTRGLMVDPATKHSFQPVEEVVHSAGEVDGMFTGMGFTDGSLMCKYRVGGQCGWSAVEWEMGAAQARLA
eukprot:4089116-Karenia_brevis.AAC.1